MSKIFLKRPKLFSYDTKTRLKCKKEENLEKRDLKRIARALTF